MTTTTTRPNIDHTVPRWQRWTRYIPVTPRAQVERPVDVRLGALESLRAHLQKPDTTAEDLRAFAESTMRNYPWTIEIEDWTGQRYSIGKGEPHWCGEPLRLVLRRPDAGRDLLALDGMRFLERFLEGDVDMTGNLYALQYVKEHSELALRPWRLLPRMLKQLAFQSLTRAKVNVKSHYDIAQEALNVYLDQVYMSYSCGMFEDPDRYDLPELLRVGRGESDDFDSLEKAQWRKFKDAVDYVAPAEGETLLDVGCGYGGQLVVALENHPFGKVVGWTHSKNQVQEGRRYFEGFDRSRWELREGDYREDDRVFDHITSTGMISHVGPRGLVPYVRNVRRRIRTGGRYVHHSLMTCYEPLPLDLNLGISFNKKYVWPGFHWFTLGQHVRALEKNGFQVVKVVNLSRHYAKTGLAWYARMMDKKDVMIEHMGEPTFRAWQIFLAGALGGFHLKDIHVCRLYCEAV